MKRLVLLAFVATMFVAVCASFENYGVKKEASETAVIQYNDNAVINVADYSYEMEFVSTGETLPILAYEPIWIDVVAQVDLRPPINSDVKVFSYQTPMPSAKNDLAEGLTDQRIKYWRGQYSDLV